MNRYTKFDLQDRLLDFAVRIIKVAESLPRSQIGVHVTGQLGRSGTSPAANYSEAQGAESKNDFVHKLRLCLKELRETRVWLLITCRAELIKPMDKLAPLLQENEELIAIFVKSLETATKRKPITLNIEQECSK